MKTKYYIVQVHGDYVESIRKESSEMNCYVLTTINKKHKAKHFKSVADAEGYMKDMNVLYRIRKVEIDENIPIFGNLKD